MNKLNILQNFDRDNYFTHPYPYFFINNCFSDKIYNQLSNDYKLIINYLKKKNDFKTLNNTRLQINAKNFMKEDFFKKTIWYDFVKFHTSKEFLKNLIMIFEKDLKNFYPEIFNAFNNFYNDENYLKIRDNDNKDHRFVIDCQPGINTPVIKQSNVRGPHVDNPVEIFGGLFYLRDENDNSKGGDLDIYDVKNNEICFEGKAEVKNISKIKKVKIFKYDKNRCIFFLNSLKTIHGVSERSETKYTRNLTNFVIETYFYDRLFNLNKCGLKQIIKNLVKKIS